MCRLHVEELSPLGASSSYFGSSPPYFPTFPLHHLAEDKRLCYPLQTHPAAAAAGGPVVHYHNVSYPVLPAPPSRRPASGPAYPASLGV